jgi:phosphoglycerate dehydrogenase-like enzyme
MIFMMNLPSQYIERILEIAPEWEIIHGKESSCWKQHLKDVEILAHWNKEAARECLNAESKLRWVHTWSAGVNKMPMDELKQLNIRLTNSSGVHPFPISETIFAMILAYTRQLHTYLGNQKEKQWSPSKNSLEMHGKTMGIIGVGSIGKETAKLAKAFGMKVLGVRRSGGALSNVDKMYDLNGWDEMLSQSDYIINTLPLTEETHYMVGKDQFNKMKPSAFYVNIGRGETTDTDALIRALQEKKIAGAGLDVFEQEPLPTSSPLWEMENVIITPHTSGGTEHYNDRVMDIFITNLKKYLIDGEPNINLVDLGRKY